MKHVMAVAVLLVGMWAGSTWANWVHDDPDADLLRKYERQVQVNDSTVVLLAQERAEKRELQGLLTAAKQINGKLVAGVKARLELAAVGGTTTTMRLPDSSGVAEERLYSILDSAWTRRPDSTLAFRGVLSGILTVPPVEAPVLEWLFEPAPVEPSVGFVQYFGRYLAVVTCDGCKRVTIEAPFVDAPAIAAQPRLVKTVGMQYDIIAADWTARAGVDLRLFRGLNVGLEGRRTLRPDMSSQLLAGIALRF